MRKCLGTLAWLRASQSSKEMKTTKHGCHFHLRRKTKGRSCLSGSCGSQTQEEQLSRQQLFQAVCLISVCSSAAARQHKTELRGIAAIRITVLRRMFIWKMSADPSSEVSPLLLPVGLDLTAVGLDLTAALQRPFSSLSYVRNHLHSSPPMIPTQHQHVGLLHTHTPWSY